MANLTISNVCNMKCPYCFAEEYMGEAKVSHSTAFLTLEDFDRRLDFVDRSGLFEIRLIGGEPTLHPQFPDIIRRANARGKLIRLFSHGLMPERAIASLEELGPFDCIVLVNMNAMRTADGPSEKEVTQRIETIRRLGMKATLGFTIYRSDFDLEPIFRIIEEVGCRRSLRLGLANPILLAENEYLPTDQYPVVGQRIVDFARRAAQSQISLEFDCGFVRCMFSDNDLQVLQQTNTQFGFHCSPVLDVGIDGQTIPCFPLTGRIQAHFEEFPHAGIIRQSMLSQLGTYRTEGILAECVSCRFKLSGECSGGCLSATMRRLEVK